MHTHQPLPRLLRRSRNLLIRHKLHHQPRQILPVLRHPSLAEHFRADDLVGGKISRRERGAVRAFVEGAKEFKRPYWGLAAARGSGDSEERVRNVVSETRFTRGCGCGGSIVRVIAFVWDPR